MAMMKKITLKSKLCVEGKFWIPLIIVICGVLICGCGRTSIVDNVLNVSDSDVVISDGKDGRVWKNWSQKIEERYVDQVIVTMRRKSGGDNTYVNLRFKGENALDGGKRAYLKDDKSQVSIWQVGRKPRSKPLIINAYNGEVVVEEVSINYSKLVTEDLRVHTAISDGKDGRLWKNWSYKPQDKYINEVRVTLRRQSEHKDIFVNLRFKGENALEGGKRVYVKSKELKTFTWEVDRKSRGNLLVLNAYNGEVYVEKVEIEYFQPTHEILSPKIVISDGKDGRLWKNWSYQTPGGKYINTVWATVKRKSGNDDTYVNLRFKGEDALDGGKRFYLKSLKNGMAQIGRWTVERNPHGKPLILNAYKGEVIVEKVKIEYAN